MSMALCFDGASSYLNVITAQVAALVAEDSAIVIHARELNAHIGSMLALRGGCSNRRKPMIRMIILLEALAGYCSMKPNNPLVPRVAVRQAGA